MVLAVTAALFVVSNVGMWLAYRNRVLPNVSVGAVAVGNVAYADLDATVDTDQLLPHAITLQKEAQAQAFTPDQLGITVDWRVTEARLKQQRTWLPIFNLFAHKTVALELMVNQQQFTDAQVAISQHFNKQPLAQRIVFSGTTFEIASPEAGYQLDQSKFQQELLEAVERGQTSLEVPTEMLQPEQITGGLESDLAALRQQLATPVKFVINGNNVEPQAADKGSWFVPTGRTMVFSAAKLQAYLRGLDGSAWNLTNAADAVQYALGKNIATTFVVGTAQTAKKYTYCAAGKSVDQSHLPGFFVKTAAVLGDPRGWQDGGAVAFERVENGCDFSLWLSAPSQMTSFGGLCDDYYSCRSGRNVVINFDRWQGATPPWNAAGGNLEDYRVMVTNHEVGHWLGFAHRYCTGPGQPAPVMQQQSIDLQGCTFNPWPTAAELAAI